MKLRILAPLDIEATGERCDPSCRYLASPWDTGTHPDGKPGERQERYCHAFRVAVAKAGRGAVRCEECMNSAYAK